MTDKLTAQALGKMIFKTFGVVAEDEIEVQRDKLDKHRLMIIHYPKEVSGRGLQAPAQQTQHIEPPSKEAQHG